MALLVVVVGLAAPTLGNFFRGRTLDSEARRLLSLTRHGQSRAVSEGVPMVLWVDAKQRSYGLEADSSYDDHDAKAEEYAVDQTLQIEAINVGAVNLATALRRTISGNTTTGSQHRNLPGIRFQPDGSVESTSPQLVQLTDRNGASLWLAQSTNRLNYEIRNNSN
jgi:Tfp pilus assembly protein FimT